jgi:hypothetical protein
VALHQSIQKLLLIGARLDTPPALPIPDPPPRLRPLIEALFSAHADFDVRAIAFGHRYRSGFWVIYLLSAVAVLCAMMPLALGWDDLSNYMHSYAAAWVIAEILVIAGVGFIYWRGHRNDWQGCWLRARTVAELTSYLPLIAPLVDFTKSDAEPSWYARADLPHLATPAEVAALCRAHEVRARELLGDAWSDPQFVAAYADWTVGILQSQQAYHARVARRSHVLQHRIHRVTTGLFAFTALAALAHLIIHSRWISMITTVFPALAAALHGALAQSEAYRLQSASERVVLELGKASSAIRKTFDTEPPALRNERFKTSVRDALGVILQEHQDWYMLVRPHHLPLG